MSLNRQSYHKKYYAENKAKFQIYEKQTYHCDICNKDIRKYYKKQHEETPKHLSNQAKTNNLSGGNKLIMKKALINSIEKLVMRIDKLQKKINALE